MIINLLILILSFFAIWILINTYLKVDHWQISFLLSICGSNLYLILITELLSLFRQLNKAFVLGSWILPLLVLGIVAINSKSRRKIRIPNIPLHDLTWYQLAIVCVVALILLILAVTAFFAPPNTSDVLNYHMPRVMHWIQNQSVRHFATGIEFQNSYPPAAEYQMLHLALIFSSDRFVNFASWFMLLGASICVALFAKLINIGKTGQLLTSLFLVTLPGAILQATTAKNDLHVAFWVIFVLTFMINYFYHDKSHITLIIIFLGIGIGFLTKANTIIFLIPILFWFAILFVRQEGLRKSIVWIGIALLIFMVVNSGFIIRNLQTYGTPIDTYQSGRLTNEWISPRGILTNLLRNTTFHLQFPWSEVREWIRVFLLKVHMKLGIDVNDPRTTSEGFFLILDVNTHENFSGNTLHTLLLLPFTLIYLYQVRSKRPSFRFLSPIIFSLTGFIFFSTLIKWQIFGARYFLPVFFIASPILGGVFDRIKHNFLHIVIPAILLFCAWPWLFSAEIRPLVTGTQYSNSPSIFTTKRIELLLGCPEEGFPGLIKLQEFSDQIGCRNIGIYGGGVTTEYHIWATLGAPFNEIRLEWIVAGSPSSSYADPNFNPCLIICHDCPADQDTIRTFQRFFNGARYSIFLPDNHKNQ